MVLTLDMGEGMLLMCFLIVTLRTCAVSSGDSVACLILLNRLTCY